MTEQIPQIPVANISVRFCNEIIKSISEDGFEDSTKFMKNIVANIFTDALMFPPQKGIPKTIIVPMSNVASYWVES